MSNGSGHIFIVDDNPDNLRILGHVIQDQGYDITLSSNGKDALEFLKNEKPDLILLDIMMPEINGFELCQKIKQNPDFKNIPIIFISAIQNSKDIIKGFELGAVDYVSKPFNSKELIARVNVHVQLKKALEEIKVLRGIIPICANCKKIKNDEGYWEQVEEYIQHNTDATFTHSLCKECSKKLYGNEDWFKEEDLM
jgi:DNA-binding response OmpR family regulator